MENSKRMNISQGQQQLTEPIHDLLLLELHFQLSARGNLVIEITILAIAHYYNKLIVVVTLTELLSVLNNVFTIEHFKNYCLSFCTFFLLFIFIFAKVNFFGDEKFILN